MGCSAFIMLILAPESESDSESDSASTSYPSKSKGTGKRGRRVSSLRALQLTGYSPSPSASLFDSMWK